MLSRNNRTKVKQVSKLSAVLGFLRSTTMQITQKQNLFTRTACQNVSQSNSNVIESFKILNTIVGLSLIFAVGCTYKSPATEYPIPSNQGVDKSFFVTSKIDPKTGKEISVPKTFLCGWASEMETGWSAEYGYTNNALVPDHCNLVFEITESVIYGKLINPSFPDDPSRWENVIAINIKSHYYLENDKDDNGKDKKKVIKNSDRSHWSARPFMDLDFENINFKYKWKSMFDYGSNIANKIKDVEWDNDKGFLAFTLEHATYGSHHARIRFNFKEFKHNPEFKSTPFNDQNYKRMNVLHIIGEKINGVHPILHAAHWDLNTQHEIRMWQVPEEYKAVVKEVVADWNETFRKIGAVEAGRDLFWVNDKEAEHAFDLRYSSIAWVADDKISTYSPLGIGMAIADVKNGEIKWGMITLYGGYIEKYIKSYAPNATGGSALSKMASQVLGKALIPQNLELPLKLKQLSLTSPMTMTQHQSELASQTLMAAFMAQQKQKGLKKPTTESEIEDSKKSAAALPAHIQSMFSEMINQSQSQISKSQMQQANTNYADIIRKSLFPSVKKEDLEEQKKLSNTKEKDILSSASPQFCNGRTFADVGPGWAEGSRQLKGSLEVDKKVLRHVVKELITHEYGHFLGLGHQFKENILPTKGTVPDTVYKNLAAEANAEAGFTNYTSVMGYRNPRSEIADYKKNILPGPQDELVLRFLYKLEYSTFKTGDADFTFADVPKNGIIPDAIPGKQDYKTTYFPQCNDLEASYSLDPFCNRFDRGYDAVTIVQNYFSDLKDTMTQSMFAFTDAKGGCAECVEGALWRSSLRTMGRVRLFYDYMRLYYKNEFDQIRNDEEALFEFSTACKSKDIKSNSLKRIFADKPDLKVLCQANGIALDEFKKLVSKKVVDFTKKDFSERFSPGGMDGGDAERDYSRITGSWTEMTGQPMKISALYALTTGVPWVADYGFSVPLFDDPNLKFSYSFLYPKEYTQVIASNVRNNMRFASLGENEKTSMGSSLISMSWFNYEGQNGNNDANLFPPQFVEKIRNQGKFEFSAVAIIMKGRKKEDNTNYVDAFDGEVYDFNTSKSTPLTNAYLLPGGLVVVNTPNMFLYPITRFAPFSDTEGYVFAYKLDYFRDPMDPLADVSVKNDLNDLNNQLVDACVMGANGVSNGLSHFFSSSVPEFKGFKMTTGLARGERKEFLDSIEDAYKTYYAYPKFKNAPPTPKTCLESLRGLGLIISSAAVLNGFWLPEVMDYIQK
ncbi:MAG: hypothetical protein H7061_10630 [Bdellovibrionaceae bacterium]|nr:hypothetical protein [Bdellovibrio sp.]